MATRTVTRMTSKCKTSYVSRLQGIGISLMKVWEKIISVTPSWVVTVAVLMMITVMEWMRATATLTATLILMHSKSTSIPVTSHFSITTATPTTLCKAYRRWEEFISVRV